MNLCVIIPTVTIRRMSKMKKKKQKTYEELIKDFNDTIDTKNTILFGSRLYNDKLKNSVTDILNHFNEELLNINKKLDKIIK